MVRYLKKAEVAMTIIELDGMHPYSIHLNQKEPCGVTTDFDAVLVPMR
jgi:hypothetical protein